MNHYLLGNMERGCIFTVESVGSGGKRYSQTRGEASRYLVCRHEPSLPLCLEKLFGLVDGLLPVLENGFHSSS